MIYKHGGILFHFAQKKDKSIVILYIDTSLCQRLLKIEFLFEVLAKIYGVLMYQLNQQGLASVYAMAALFLNTCIRMSMEWIQRV